MVAEEQVQQPTQAPQPQPDKKSNIQMIVGVVLVILLFGGIIIGFTFRSAILTAISNIFSTEQTTTQVTPVTEIGPEEKVVQGGVEEVEVVSPTPVEENEEDLIKKAVIDAGGFAASEVEVTVSENTGTHAKGGVKEVGSEVGGGYFIAAKFEGEWAGVYSGQANPTCEQIEPYDFPTEMVEECLDENGDVVTRNSI